MPKRPAARTRSASAASAISRSTSRSVSRNVAPGSRIGQLERGRPSALASSDPIARPRPKPPSLPRSLPRLKRSKISSRSAAGTPGPSSATSIDGGPAPLRDRAPRSIECGGGDLERVVEHDSHDPRDAAGVGLRPGAVADLVEHDRDLALLRAQVELGRHRARGLDELDRLVAQLEPGIDAAEVEQVLREPRQPPRLQPARARRARARRRRRPDRWRGPRPAARASCRATRAACAAHGRPSR